MKCSLVELIAAVRRDLKGKKAVIGISGGKDSSITAAILVLALGRENVIGVSMPNGEGKEDSPYVDLLEDFLKIEIKRINIKNTYDAALAELNDMKILEDTKINLAPRIRMSMLFAISQSIPNSRVINTCNLSEDMMGYSTLFGDMAGSYSVLKYFTVTEIIHEIGQKLIDYFGFPEKLVHRIPSDGLCGSSDEEKMGMKYEDIDSYIRHGDFRESSSLKSIEDTVELINKIKARYEANKFKLDIINIPAPSIDSFQGNNYITGDVREK